MATYVVSDIHGCFDELMDALALAGVDFAGGDVLYVLGDVVDRGPKVAECVHWLVSQNEDSVRFLLGNHEQMMLDAIRGDWEDMPIPHMDDLWSCNGGRESAEAMVEELTPDERRAFYEMCRRAPIYAKASAGGRDFLLVHAGFDMHYGSAGQSIGAWLDAQSLFDMLWVREPWFCSPSTPPVTTVFGHTTFRSILPYLKEIAMCAADEGELADAGYDPSNRNDPANAELLEAKSPEPRILTWNGRVSIDGGCCNCGSLELLRLDDATAFYVPASAATEQRFIERGMGWIPSCDWNALATDDGFYGDTAILERKRTLLAEAAGMFAGVRDALSDEAVEALADGYGMSLEAPERRQPRTEKIRLAFAEDMKKTNAHR